MTGTKVWMRGLFQKTVWSHYNTANIPYRYKLVYTLVLPIMYTAMFMYGLIGVAAPIPSIDLVFGRIYGDMWSITLMTSGVAALIGVGFYARLIWVEVVADVAVVTLMIIYAGCVILAALLGAEVIRAGSLMIVAILLPLPAWRILDIVRELRPPRVS